MKHLIVTAFLISLAGCPGPIQPGTDIAIDCLGSNRAQIDALLTEFKPLLFGGKVSWSQVYTRAKQAGSSVGGCFIMELAQSYLGGTRSPADAQLAYDTAAKFKHDELKDASVITMCVREDGTSELCKL